MLVIELDAETELPENVTVFGELDPVEAAVWVMGLREPLAA